MTHPDPTALKSVRLPELRPGNVTPPTLNPARLDAMISHALAQPQQGGTATSGAAALGARILAFVPRHRLAVSGGGMALAASLALAVVLFHNAPANIGTGISYGAVHAAVAQADNLKDVSDMMTLDVLDAAI